MVSPVPGRTREKHISLPPVDTVLTKRVQRGRSLHSSSILRKEVEEIPMRTGPSSFPSPPVFVHPIKSPSLHISRFFSGSTGGNNGPDHPSPPDFFYDFGECKRFSVLALGSLHNASEHAAISPMTPVRAESLSFSRVFWKPRFTATH